MYEGIRKDRILSPTAKMIMDGCRSSLGCYRVVRAHPSLRADEACGPSIVYSKQFFNMQRLTGWKKGYLRQVEKGYKLHVEYQVWLDAPTGCVLKGVRAGSTFISSSFGRAVTAWCRGATALASEENKAVGRQSCIAAMFLAAYPSIVLATKLGENNIQKRQGVVVLESYAAVRMEKDE